MNFNLFQVFKMKWQTIYGKWFVPPFQTDRRMKCKFYDCKSLKKMLYLTLSPGLTLHFKSQKNAFHTNPLKYYGQNVRIFERTKFLIPDSTPSHYNVRMSLLLAIPQWLDCFIQKKLTQPSFEPTFRFYYHENVNVKKKVYQKFTCLLLESI